MSRETFLARVRQAAQIGRAYRVHTDEIAESAGYVGACEGDLCVSLAAEIEAVGGVAHLVADFDAAREQLLDLLDQYNAQSVLLWRHDVLRRIGLQTILDEADVAAFDHERLSAMDDAAARGAILAADVGVTSCDIAVAETGSLIVVSRPGQERVVSLLPPVHIAVVERRQIVPDLFDACEQLGRLDFDDQPSNVTIITGPSKTGDIELTLTTGVHGPGNWHVIVIAANGEPGASTP